MTRQTSISIQGDSFHINGQPTYAGRVWRGHRIEGLLLNSRMVQGVFDDLNEQTRSRWDYLPPNPGRWDPDRNTDEFIAAMPQWREHGLLSFTINLQGGSPEGYSEQQPWENSAFEPDGTLRDAYMARLERILDRADELGMAPIVGYFYFGQDQRLRDEAAVVHAARHATQWLLERRYTNTLIEINNECDISYDHAILRPGRVRELIDRVKRQADGRLLVSTSYSGGKIVEPGVAQASDFILLHGNGVGDPDGIRRLVRQVREVDGYHGQPILFNEDDHYDFDKPDNHMIAALGEHASWGFFDYRFKGEGYEQGYQSVPVDWGISSPRKRGFFDRVRDVAGALEQSTVRHAGDESVGPTR